MASSSVNDVGTREENFCGIIIDANDIRIIRKYFQNKILHDKLIVRKINNLELLITTTSTFIPELKKLISILDGKTTIHGIKIKLANITEMELNNKKMKSPYQCLVKNLKLLMLENNLWDDSYIEDIPKHWEKHGSLILLPSSCFLKKAWNKCPNLWETVAKVLKCEKLAKKNSVKPNDFRSPHTELLLGSDGWTTCRENGIKYTYDVTKCMFSAGNITEKLRISKFDCTNEIVIDMYAGIGYFTLPYLVHANAAKVHACEWNPDAVNALKKNLVLNHVDDKCIIHFGDNRKVCPIGIADRVNLGLLPSSESGWKTACLALKPNGGILHIHGNVETKITRYKNSEFDVQSIDKTDSTSKFNNRKETQSKSTKLLKIEWINWAEETAEKIKSFLFGIYNRLWNVTILHVEHVKSYAPHIDHLVVDIKCE